MIDIEQVDNRLKISYFDEKGKVSIKEIPIPRTEKYKWEYAGSERKDLFYKSWDKKPVKRTQSFYLNRFRIEEFLISLGEEYLADIYNFNEPEIWVCDIEVGVASTGEFPDPTKANTPIITVSLVSTSGKSYVLGTRDLDHNRIVNIEKRFKKYFEKFAEVQKMSFEYIQFKSEAELLLSLFSKWFKQAPVLTGWNFISFDWTFLINRCKRHGIDPANASISNKLKGENEIPVHKVVVDYLDLYKKWDRVVKIKDNFKLETVANAVLGISKVKFAGSLTDLYNNDYDTYVFYNIVDSILVNLIHTKINTMQTFLLLGTITRVEHMKAFSPIWMTECLMIREFYKRKAVIVEMGKNKKTGSFEGAYVKDPIKGLHEWLATFDFASLYPRTMMQYNMSAETFLGKLDEIPEDENWVKTASGAVFDNSYDSVIRVILTEYYAKRKEYKGCAFEIEKEIAHLEKILKTK